MESVKVVALAFALASCTDSKLEIRVCNRTGYAIAEATAAEFHDLALADGECTESIEPKSPTYGYTGGEFSVGADRFTYTPIDILGPPLSSGRWSYELRIQNYPMHLVSMNAVEDE